MGSQGVGGGPVLREPRGPALVSQGANSINGPNLTIDKPEAALDEARAKAVATGRARAGYVISTRGPWLAHRRWPGALAFLPAPGPDDADAFPVSAALRKSDGDLKDAVDRAWVDLERSGRLSRAFARWQVPYEPITAAHAGSFASAAGSIETVAAQPVRARAVTTSAVRANRVRGTLQGYVVALMLSVDSGLHREQ